MSEAPVSPQLLYSPPCGQNWYCYKEYRNQDPAIFRIYAVVCRLSSKTRMGFSKIFSERTQLKAAVDLFFFFFSSFQYL